MDDRATHPAILDQETLSTITGYDRPADIERELKRRGIRFFRGRRGIWTTVDAANEALGVHSTDRDDTMAWLAARFQASPAWRNLKPTTQRDYTTCIERILASRTTDGRAVRELPIKAWTLRLHHPGDSQRCQIVVQIIAGELQESCIVAGNSRSSDADHLQIFT